MANADRPVRATQGGTSILSAGYGCNAVGFQLAVDHRDGDTVADDHRHDREGPAGLSPEATPSLLGEVYTKGAAKAASARLARRSATARCRAGTSRTYVADAHPEIKTVEDAMKHPELFPSSEDPSKGAVIQGPQGWGDTVVTAQLFKALNNPNFVMVPTGSAAALDGVIAKAYEQKQGMIAQYWSPTSLLAKYPDGAPRNGA
jgi:glycine betaine/proline transport system substrate-binding protein